MVVHKDNQILETGPYPYVHSVITEWTKNHVSADRTEVDSEIVGVFFRIGHKYQVFKSMQ